MDTLAHAMYQPVFSKISHDISIEVKPVYLEQESNLLAGKHVFAYFIAIRNLSDIPVQLLRRHWEINDAAGRKYEVGGEGVIGKQPVIDSGEEYGYNSFCVLKSYHGNMIGYYIMEQEGGRLIKVNIPRFLLSSHLLN